MLPAYLCFITKIFYTSFPAGFGGNECHVSCSNKCGYGVCDNGLQTGAKCRGFCDSGWQNISFLCKFGKLIANR